MPLIKVRKKQKNRFRFCYSDDTAYVQVACRLFICFLFSLLYAPTTASLAATNGRHDLQFTFSSIPTLNCTTAGFRIYDESQTKIFETTNTDSNEIICPDVELAGTKATFTMTSFCSDGRESAHSAPFTVTLPDETSLNAVISATPSSGPGPLDVVFNGGNSTGSVANYQWSFGDGSAPVNGEKVTHRFVAVGEYTVTLTVSDGPNNTCNKATVRYLLTVSRSTTDNSPPTAVISVTSTVGRSPLSVTFDGSKSSDADGDKLIYSWNFGDGDTSTGSSSVTHIYSNAGTYYATLTVTDGTNQTTSRSIPVLVAGGNNVAVDQPKVSISINRKYGSAPLAVRFNGSASTASSKADNIIRYKWDFGDGSTATGKNVTHIFPVIGKYVVTLTVTDKNGGSNTATVTINVQGKNDIEKLLPLIYRLLLLNHNHQHTK